LASWAVVLVPVVIVGVGAWSHRWVTEDAFIDFRVVGNILSGNGPVFNVGERVEAYTDPLWVAMLVVFRGCLPFVSVEWWSVVLGLACTVIGFSSGGRAAQRLGASAGNSLVIPIGLLAASVVAGVWDFSTSGLETGLTFAWLGVSWWLMVRVVERRRHACTAAFVIGLGFLIRPDLALISATFLVALSATIKAPGWSGPIGRWQRWGAPAVAALFVPVGYEVFRMAYFGLLLPNTALAKSASSTWWSQGFHYLRDFEGQYWLWVPLLCLSPVVFVRLLVWWRSSKRVEAVVLAAPLTGGLLSVTYVVAVGGDFMHARMLLPGFFAMVLAMWVAPRRIPDWTLAAGVVAFAWCVTCLIAFRPTPITFDAQTKSFVGATNNIENERSVWVLVSGYPNPISLADYSGVAGLGNRLQSVATHSSGGFPRFHQVVAPIIESLTGQDTIGALLPGTGALPEPVVANLVNIGIRGVAAGNRVYIFDELSLANPIGSHFQIVQRTRPGHEKVVGLDWMLARFTPEGTAFPADLGISATDVAYARTALSCAPLSSYLAGITGTWTIAKAFSNAVHSVAYTDMTYSAQPRHAMHELCGRNARPDGR
jgi:arabinofuranosyltransferase